MLHQYKSSILNDAFVVLRKSDITVSGGVFAFSCYRPLNLNSRGVMCWKRITTVAVVHMVDIQRIFNNGKMLWAECFTHFSFYGTVK